MIEADGLQVDLAARVVRRGGEEVHLTPIEFDLLRVLVRNRGRLLTHRALLQEVWGQAYADDVADAAHQHRAPAPQDRARGRSRAALHPHGSRRRLPLRRLARRCNEIVMPRRRIVTALSRARADSVGMDFIAILLAAAAFALLLALIEGLDRV